MGSEAESGDGVIDGDEYQMQYLVDDDEAWRSIGLIPVNFSTYYTPPTTCTHGYTNLSPLSQEGVVMTILNPGGQHAPSTWEQEFAAALPFLYRADPYDKMRHPKQEQYTFVAVDEGGLDNVDDNIDTDEEDDDSVKLSTGLLAAIVIMPVVLTCFAFLVYIERWLKPKWMKNIDSAGVKASLLANGGNSMR